MGLYEGLLEIDKDRWLSLSLHGNFFEARIVNFCRRTSSPLDLFSEPEREASADGSPHLNIFLARDNPRQFFVREPLPSTNVSTISSPAPAAQPQQPSSSGAAGPSRRQPSDAGPSKGMHAPCCVLSVPNGRL